MFVPQYCDSCVSLRMTCLYLCFVTMVYIGDDVYLFCDSCVSSTMTYLCLGSVV